jgi:guanylate kinase
VVTRGDLFIVSSPSGGGKTTLIGRLMEDAEASSGLEFSVSHTTRSPRPGEVDGREYHFVTEERFAQMVKAGDFLEWAEVHGHRYGTSRGEVMPRLVAGHDVILDIDVQGAAQVLEALPEAIAVFVVPPSYRALAERLTARGQDDPSTVARRLAVSRWELERYREYRYVIINDDVDRASRELASIILAQRCRLGRRAERIEEILSGFPPADPEGAGTPE